MRSITCTLLHSLFISTVAAEDSRGWEDILAAEDIPGLEEVLLAAEDNPGQGLHTAAEDIPGPGAGWELRTEADSKPAEGKLG